MTDKNLTTKTCMYSVHNAPAEFYESYEDYFAGQMANARHAIAEIHNRNNVNQK